MTVRMAGSGTPLPGRTRVREVLAPALAELAPAPYRNCLRALAGRSMAVAAAIPPREARAAEPEARITRVDNGKGTPLSALRTGLDRRIQGMVRGPGAALAANGGGPPLWGARCFRTPTAATLRSRPSNATGCAYLWRREGHRGYHVLQGLVSALRAVEGSFAKTFGAPDRS
jgi:hypothetical protein